MPSGLTAGGERPVDRVEGYIVDGVDEGLVLRRWRLVTPMTLEGEVVGRILLFNISIRGKMNPGKDRKSTRLNSSHSGESRMPSSA